MKKLFTIIALCLLTFIKAQTPTFNWAKKMGGLSNESGYAIALDASGNVYTTGYFEGTVDFDPGAGVFNLVSSGLSDIFIQKLDAAGNFVWAKKMGGTGGDEGRGITIDASGNIVTVGSFSGTVDFDPGAGFFNLISGGGFDIFVHKLDASGNFVWAKLMGSGSTDFGFSIKTDISGNVYSTGSFQGTVDFDPGAGVLNLTSSSGSSDIFVQKLDASGNFVWAKSMGSTSSDVGYGTTLDGLGNVYTTGYYVGTVDFDPSVGVFNLTATGGGSDIFIQKLDANGNFIWAKSVGNTSNDIGYAITIDGLGNIYSTGYFQGTVDFNPGPGVSNFSSSGSTDIYVLKLDANGNYLWSQSIGGSGQDVGQGITTDGSGNVYTTGYFNNTVDLDPGAGVTNQTSLGFSEIFIQKLDATGNFAWGVAMGNSGYDYGLSLASTSSGLVYTTGSFQGNVDFDSSAGVFNLASSGGFDIFVHKLAPCASAPSQPGSISGLNSMCAGSGATSYSIATVSSATSYSWNLPGGWSGTSSTNTISATPGTSGVFSVTANNACGASPQQTLAVTVNPLPTVSVNSGSICIGQSFTISPSGAATYTIQGGNAVVSPTSSSTYSVIGTSASGCISSAPASSSVTVNPLPAINASTSNTLICAGQTATLTASGAFTYTWNPGGVGTSIAVSPSLTTTYTISGTSSAGCNNVSTITQSVSACTSINETAIPVMIRIYPNPAHSSFFIETAINNFNLKLYDAYGKLIVEKIYADANTVEINLQEMNAGIYFVELEAEGRRSYFKLVKE
ncbi:MAG: SBBP repeat-containing protein [Bacteroidetes bacterium]|nr:SBBP repeat-containing protein [Bacteroidota bacterium]